MKLAFARLAQELSGLEVELLGDEGLRYADWTMTRPDQVDFTGRDAGYRYLRAKGNSIEGGTSEILRNIIAERVLGLPAEPRVDKDVAVEGHPPMSDLTRPAACCPPTSRTTCAPPCAGCSRPVRPPTP